MQKISKSFHVMKRRVKNLYNEIGKKDIFAVVLILLVQVLLVAYFLNIEDDEYPKYDINAATFVAGVDVSSSDIIIDLDLFSCGMDGDCEAFEDNNSEWVSPNEILSLNITSDNVGYIPAENTEFKFNIPDGLCYKIGSIENELPANIEVKYSKQSIGSANWTYIPQADSENTDCNVRAMRGRYISDFEPSLQFSAETASFSGTLNGLIEASQQLVIDYPGPFSMYGSISHINATNQQTTSITNGDADNDGDKDIVISKDGGYDSLFLNDGDGNFTYSQLIQESFSYNYDSEFGDVDNDGDLDLVHVIHNYYDYLNLNNGSGVFTLAPDMGYGLGRLPGGNQRSIGLDINDYNGDGYLDIAVANRTIPHESLIHLNNGSGQFVPGPDVGLGVGVLPPGARESYYIDGGDVDNDGDVDLVIFNRNSRNSLLLNDGTGAFSLGADMGYGAGELPGIVSISWRGELVDFNNDGFLDIIDISDGTENQILLNDGTGGFILGPDVGYGAGILPGGLRGNRGGRYADFDSDGDTDILLFSKGTTAPNGYNLLLQNDGTGHFVLWPDFGYGLGILPGGTQNDYQGAVFDFDGNGTQDIVTAPGNGVAPLLISNNIREYNTNYDFIITPIELLNWTSFNSIFTEDSNSSVRFSLLDSSCSNVISGFDNVVLSGLTDLSLIDQNTYSELCLRIHLYAFRGELSPSLDEWILTYRSRPEDIMSAQFRVSEAFEPNTYTYEITTSTTSVESKTDNNKSIASITLVPFSGGIIITDIGLIDDVPPLDDLLYYFKSPNPFIQGWTLPNSTVHFVEGDLDYSVKSNGDGYYAIRIESPVLDLGDNKFEYFSITESGFESVRKHININYDPNYGDKDGDHENGDEEVVVPSSYTTSEPPDKSTHKDPENVVTETEEELKNGFFKGLETNAVNLSIIVATLAFSSTVVTLLAMMLSLLLNLPPLLIRGWNSLLVLFGLRRKGESFGFVYDSQTKEPIVHAILRVFDNKGKLMRTDVTSVDGIYYTYIENGQYWIEVSKRGYQFPTKLILADTDGIYQNVYHGEEFSIRGNTELSLAIPGDRGEISLSEEITFFIRDSFMVIARRVLQILFFVGFTLSIIVFVYDPNILNLMICLIYLPVFLVSFVFSKYYSAPKYGVVSDGSFAIPELLIGVKEINFGRLVAQRATTKDGQYRFILNPGEYEIVIMDKKYELAKGEQSQFHIEEKNSVITRDLNVKKVL
jgi:hypothetical protein